MLADFQNETQFPPNPDVIVVGAGAVGLALAVDLARAGKRVLLLEAGNHDLTDDSQAFFASAVSTGNDLKGLHHGRFRTLGGTTTAWGGQLVPLDPIVLESRDWVPDGGWPIARTELDAAYELAFDVFGMHKRIDDGAVWKRLRVAPPDTGEDMEFFFSRWTPVPNFARLFERDLASNPNLQTLTNAPVTGLDRSENGRTFGVTVTGRDGRRHLLDARKVVLAQGTIETARLLSMPLNDGRAAPWSDSPWLGRGFCDHVDVDAGRVTLLDQSRFHKLFDAAFLDGLKYLPKLKLSQEAQRRERLLGIAAHFVFDSRYVDDLRALKSFARGVLNRQFEDIPRPRKILPMSRVALLALAHYLRGRRIYNPGDRGITLRLTGEQVAVRESGLRLTDRKDALGMPIVEMDWRIDGAELATMAAFGTQLAGFLESEGLAQVELDPQLLNRDPAFLSRVEDGFHHMGMARMGRSAQDGVVDHNLKVFGTDNVFVTGAATFRSTGFPNPTLTGIALGLRLSRAIQEGRV